MKRNKKEQLAPDAILVMRKETRPSQTVQTPDVRYIPGKENRILIKLR